MADAGVDRNVRRRTAEASDAAAAPDTAGSVAREVIPLPTPDVRSAIPATPDAVGAVGVGREAAIRAYFDASQHSWERIETKMDRLFEELQNEREAVRQEREAMKRFTQAMERTFQAKFELLTTEARLDRKGIVGMIEAVDRKVRKGLGAGHGERQPLDRHGWDRGPQSRTPLAHGQPAETAPPCDSRCLPLRLEPGMLRLALAWLSARDVAALQASCRGTAHSWAVDEYVRAEVSLAAPGARLVAPSQLAWLALLQRSKMLAESWGDAASTVEKLREAEEVSEGSPIECLYLVKCEVGPPAFLCAAAFVAAMRRHTSFPEVQALCLSHLAGLCKPFPDAGRAAFLAGAAALLPPFLMATDDRALQAAALVVLASMAEEKTCAEELHRTVPISMLVPLFSQTSPELVQAIRAMVHENAGHCMAFRRAGGLSCLLNLLRDPRQSVQERASEIFVDILNQDRGSCVEANSLSGCLVALSIALESASHNVQGCAADAISCMAAVDASRAADIVASSIPAQLVPLLMDSNVEGCPCKKSYSRVAAAVAICTLLNCQPRTAALFRRLGAIDLLPSVLSLCEGAEHQPMMLGAPVAELLGTQDVAVCARMALNALKIGAELVVPAWFPTVHVPRTPEGPPPPRPD